MLPRQPGIKECLEPLTRASFPTGPCSHKVLHPTMLLLPGRVMLLRRVAAKHKHGQAEHSTLGNSYQPQGTRGLIQHPPFPLQISADPRQVRHTMLSLITITQAMSWSLRQDYSLVRSLLYLCLQLLSLPRKEIINLCHKDLLLHELFWGIHCHHSSASNHANPGPLGFLE